MREVSQVPELLPKGVPPSKAQFGKSGKVLFNRMSCEDLVVSKILWFKNSITYGICGGKIDYLFFFLNSFVEYYFKLTFLEPEWL